MDPELLATYVAGLTPILVQLGLRLIGAILLWIVGGFVIKMILKAVDSRMNASKMDETLRRYAQNAGSMLLKFILIIAVLGVMGVETTTFASILAAAGVAIGLAWSGLLANFAAGAFMVVLRPFKVGDFVEAGGHVGTVEEIGLFVTTITTMDNVQTIVGNNTIFSGSIKNFSHNSVRRVDCVAQLAHSVDVHEAIAELKTAVAAIPNTPDAHPADIHILEFNLAGPVLCVRPYCHTDHYWQVFFDTNMVIKDRFGAKGFPVPENHYSIKQDA